jgi:hypothetical protein
MVGLVIETQSHSLKKHMPQHRAARDGLGAIIGRISAGRQINSDGKRGMAG